MPHRILVVDDEAEVRVMLETFLHGRLGYEVQSAAEGKAALDLALETPFDLCVLDVNMPGLSGPETYMRLKSLLPEIEAIFFTADGDFNESHTFLRFSLPLERVIVKPLEDFSLMTRLIVGILGPPIA